eukprot:1156292-Pelagomonas_calceolata.AAC.5
MHAHTPACMHAPATIIIHDLRASIQDAQRATKAEMDKMLQELNVEGINDQLTALEHSLNARVQEVGEMQAST